MDPCSISFVKKEDCGIPDIKGYFLLNYFGQLCFMIKYLLGLAFITQYCAQLSGLALFF